MKNTAKKLYALLSCFLLAGTVFAWYTVYADFARFYSYEGTLFKIQDCVVPNPVTTPCFYGAFAFLGAFIWSLFILRMQGNKQLIHRTYLAYALLGGVAFAWTNVANQVGKFYGRGATPGIGCSGVPMSNPFTTPCFIGASLFLASFILSLVALSSVKKETPTL